MITNIKIITLSSFLAMFFLGLVMALIGAAARNIGLSPYQIGLLIAVQNLGFMLAVSLSGALADTHDKPKILMVGSFVLAVSFFTFYTGDLFWLNALIMLLIGAGAGTYEGVTDALILDLYPERETLYININHFFVTFGSIIITLYLIFLQMNWRQAVIQSGVVVLLLAICFGLIRLKGKNRPEEPFKARIKILTKDRVVRALFLVTALVVGAELSFMGILTTYLMEFRDFSQVTSKAGLVVFLVGVAAGRLFVGFVTINKQIPAYLMALLGFSSIVFASVFFIDLGVFSYGLMFLAGLGLSATLPLIITLAGLLYQDMAGTVLGAIKVAIPIGGTLTPLLMSLMSQYVSFRASLWLIPLSFLAGFLLLWFQLKRLQSFGLSQERRPALGVD